MADFLSRGGGKALVGLIALLQLSAAQDETFDGTVVPSNCTSPVISILELSYVDNCRFIAGGLTVNIPSTNTRTDIALPSLVTVVGDIVFSGSELPGGFQTPVDRTIGLQHLNEVTGSVTFRNLSLSQSPIPPGLSAQALTFDNVNFNIGTGLADSVVELNVAIQNITMNACSGLSRLETQLIPDSDGTLSNASFTATGNQNLMQISLHGYGDVRTDVVVQNNDLAMSLELNDLSTGSLNLVKVQEFRATGLESLVPSVTGSGSIFQDNRVQSFEFPALTSIDGASVQFANNMNLNAISMPSLTSISNLTIFSMSELQTVDLSSVETIDTLEVSGNFATVDFGDDRDITINDSVDLEPQDNVCSKIRTLESNYQCTPTGVLAGGLSGVNGTSSSSDNSAAAPGGGGLSTGAKIGIGVGVGVGGLLILLVALFFIFRKRRRSRPNPRALKSDDWRFTSDKGEQSPVRYTKVSAVSDTVEEPSPQSSHRPVSGHVPDNWNPPGQTADHTNGRVELEEQQGPRHEMDARSLPDIDLEQDDEEDTRSLQDIERAHRSVG